MTKKLRQEFKYLENEKSFQGELKSIFHLFKRAFRWQKLSQILQCTFKNTSERLLLNSKLPNQLIYSIEIHLNTMRCSEDGIAKFYKNLDPKEAHIHNQIRICMFKIFGNTISIPLECVIHGYLNIGLYTLRVRYTQRYSQNIQNYYN